MNVRLNPVTVDRKDILINLMEKYLYEFSQYDLVPYDETGLFRDPHIDRYFTDEDRFAYFIYADERLAGFALVNKHAECPAPLDWAVAEFFIPYHFRRKGVGTAVMKRLFERHRGVWQIKYHPKNTGSEIFWQKIAAEASKNNYEVLRGNEDYFDGTPAKVLIFKV